MMADEKEIPNWAKNKRAYQKKYLLENAYTISCKLNKRTNEDLIEAWGRIPNKTQFIKEALAIYEKTNGFEDLKEYLEDEDDDR